MKFFWTVLLGLIRPLYLAYSAWCCLFPVALAGLLAMALGAWGDSGAGLRYSAWGLLALWLMLGLIAVFGVVARRTDDDPNPWQSGFMAWFGTLKAFRNLGDSAAVKLHWPSWYLVENPRGYRISGANLRTILGVLQPGDILLRGYEGYVDGAFIRRSSLSSTTGFKPGWYTHVALYVGDLTEQDGAQVPSTFQNDPGYFSPGPQRVIHAMAKGVHTEDILTFLRCDYLAVLRLPAELTLAPGQTADLRARCKQGVPPSVSDMQVTALLQTLAAGGSVPRAQVIATAKQSALEKIGEDYDFDCSDTTEFNRFSCAELLYFCLRGVQGALDLKPLAHAFYPLAPWQTRFHLLERITITPDDYYDLVRRDKLTCVWEDSFSQASHA